MTPDDLPFSPPADRNKAAILEVLTRLLPEQARVLEIASGTGQHAAHFAAGRPGWTWQPSEVDDGAQSAIAARCAGMANVLAPLRLDVLAPEWPALPARLAPLDAIYCANLLHIAPWPVCAALMRAAARHLDAHGALVLYGPYVVDDRPTAPSNHAFDADLRSRNPAWGLRRLADVATEAAGAGLVLAERIDMPTNNLAVVFRPACENLPRGAVSSVG